MSPEVNYTYLVSFGKGNPVKIGVSKNIPNRIICLQTSCPYEIEILGLILGDCELELHKRFSSDRMMGEWFEFSYDIQNFISSIPSNLANSYSHARDSCIRCKNSIQRRNDCLVIQNADGTFSGYCKKCKMVEDGRAGVPISEHHRKFVPKTCTHCKKDAKIIRHGLCPACNEYKRRTGNDRPISNSNDPCKVCDKKGAWIADGRCPPCHMYKTKHGIDRPHPKEIPHGTVSGYHRCPTRCLPCTEAMRINVATRKELKKTRPVI